MSYCFICRTRVFFDKITDLYICEICNNKREIIEGLKRYNDPNISVCKIYHNDIDMQSFKNELKELKKSLNEKYGEMNKINEELDQLKKIVDDIKIKYENSIDIMGKELDDLKDKTNEFDNYIKTKKSKKSKKGR